MKSFSGKPFSKIIPEKSSITEAFYQRCGKQEFI
jgi:hypothetical protein